MVGDDGSVWTPRMRGPATDPPRLYDHWIRKKLSVLKVVRNGREFKRLNVGIGDTTRYVHALVLEAFVGPCPDGMECCHNDGDATNNKLTNLRWDTPKANSEDARKHGTMAIGSRNRQSVYTEEFVAQIRAEAATLRPYGRIKVISRKYGLPYSSMKKIILGYCWKHVT